MNPQRKNNVLMSGPGARNADTVSPTTLIQSTSAPKTGIGPPLLSAAKDHLITHSHLTRNPQAFITMAGNAVNPNIMGNQSVRRRNSGELFFISFFSLFVIST